MVLDGRAGRLHPPVPGRPDAERRQLRQQLSFVQALTEAASWCRTPSCWRRLPESDVEAGSQRGVAALRALEKTFGRLQALWKPVATEEAFEIVRRRLFEPVRDAKARDAVCRAFADAYVAEGAKLPTETQEARYYDRLVQAYPIHPEVFDRLYEDWTTIDGFQRTRGVLKLMAKVIYRLWKDDNKDLMILPGSLPLHDGSTRNELTYYLPPGWDAVIEKDIDGDRAETTELENKEPRFGQVNAARRVARTLFLGSAPSSVATKTGIRGLDRARVLLGCLQPGKTSSVYSDALNRLGRPAALPEQLRRQDAGRDPILVRHPRQPAPGNGGPQASGSTTRPRCAARSPKCSRSSSASAVLRRRPHLHAARRRARRQRAALSRPAAGELVFARQETRIASDAVLDCMRNNGTKPRYRGNRLIFLAADHGVLVPPARCCARGAGLGLHRRGREEGRLNIDLLQKKQAEKELRPPKTCCPARPANATSGCSARCRTRRPNRSPRRGVPAEHDRRLGRAARSSGSASTTSWSSPLGRRSTCGPS